MKKSMRFLAVISLAWAIWLLVPTAGLSAKEISSGGTKIGVLTCKQVPHSRVNLLIHSTADIKCTFDSTAGGSIEHYKGESGIGFGIDVNFKADETMVFTAFSADFKAGTHQLAGKYVGAEASAAVGAGVGARALIGGNNRSISLQPALSGSTGVGAAAGLGYLYLEADD